MSPTAFNVDEAIVDERLNNVFYGIGYDACLGAEGLQLLSGGPDSLAVESLGLPMSPVFPHLECKHTL